MLEADVEVDRREFTLRAVIRVAPGERLALFGPSGAGKTTLLEVIAGLVPPRRGTVTLAGRLLTQTGRPATAVPAWQRRVGLLRQDPGLFPHLSVRANLTYAPAADAASLDGLAADLGLSGLLEAMPARLSGGQQHRVALGRLLLARCDALLLDEPYTGLDAGLRRSLTALVIRLVTERQIPSVLVAHELADAQAFATRLAIIDAGALLQDGPPAEVVLRPASRRVAELVGYLGFVPVRRPGEAPPDGGDIVAGIHPDRVIAGAHPGQGIVLTGTVTGGRPAGALWEADLMIGSIPLTCRLAGPPEAGAPTTGLPTTGLPTTGLPTTGLPTTGLPATGDGRLAVTALDPPCFGPDGTAVARPGPEPERTWPEQVSA